MKILTSILFSSLALVSGHFLTTPAEACGGYFRSPEQEVRAVASSHFYYLQNETLFKDKRTTEELTRFWLPSAPVRQIDAQGKISKSNAQKSIPHWVKNRSLLKKYSIDSVQMNGNNATVTATVDWGDTTLLEVLTLKSDKNSWKISSKTHTVKKRKAASAPTTGYSL